MNPKPFTQLNHFTYGAKRSVVWSTATRKNSLAGTKYQIVLSDEATRRLAVAAVAAASPWTAHARTNTPSTPSPRPVPRASVAVASSARNRPESQTALTQCLTRFDALRRARALRRACVQPSREITFKKNSRTVPDDLGGSSAIARRPRVARWRATAPRCGRDWADVTSHGSHIPELWTNYEHPPHAIVRGRVSRIRASFSLSPFFVPGGCCRGRCRELQQIVYAGGRSK